MSPRDAVGATIYLVAGGIRQRGDVISGGSYASSNDLRVHFGLGTSTAVEGVEIHWPSGAVERLKLPAVDRFYSVDARREAEKAVSAGPNDSSSHYILGRIYQRIGKGDLAREQFRITEQLIQAKSASLGNGMASSISQH